VGGGGVDKMPTGFWYGNLKERRLVEYIRAVGRIILKFIRLRTGTSGGLL
jgi:hypothetical protein